MLLMTPKEAATGIGSNCGGSAPGADDPVLVEILKYITQRVTDVAGVNTLVRKENVEFAQVLTTGYYELRLMNAFIVPSSVTVERPDGVIIEEANLFKLDRFLGTIHLGADGQTIGKYIIRYTSGFTLPEEPVPPPPGYDPDARVLQNVPVGLKSIATTLLIEWYRTVLLSPRVNKDISFSQVTRALDKVIKGVVYGYYMRPRYGMLFTYD